MKYKNTIQIALVTFFLFSGTTFGVAQSKVGFTKIFNRTNFDGWHLNSEGIIGFQPETAGIFYRNIEIKEFDEIIPMEKYMKKL